MWKHSTKKMQYVLKNRLVTADFDHTLNQLKQWYETPQGQQFLHLQTQWVNDHVGEMFGYHLMQMGVVQCPEFCSNSRIHHRFNVSPILESHIDPPKHNHGCDLQASPTHLPLADESVDVLLMHHALDYSHDPHQVLKEAARVTVPSGHIIIMGFNPYSFWGLKQLFKRPFSDQAIYKPQRLRSGRIEDWLALLSFTAVKTEFQSTGLFTHNPRATTTQGDSSNRSRFIQKLSALPPSRFIDLIVKRANLPIGSMYFIVARKDKAAMTPIKPLWQKTRFLGVSAIPTKTGNATAKGHYADILPMRLPFRK